MFRFFENLIDPLPKEEPTQPPKDVFAFCRHYSRGMEPLLICLALSISCIAISEVLLYAVLGELIDWFSYKNKDTFIQDNWPALLGIVTYALIFIPLATLIHTLLLHQSFYSNYSMRIRWQIHRHILKQSHQFFNNEFAGRIATKVMQTSISVREVVIKLFNVILYAVIYFITMVILVASSDWRLSIPLIVWLIGYSLILKYFLPRLQTVSIKQADARSTMTGRITDSYTNMMTLKLFSHHKRESAYVHEGMTKFLDTVYPQMRLITLLNMSISVLNMLLITSTLLLGTFFWLNNYITAGEIAIAASLSLRLLGMSNWIMWEISNLFEQIGVVQDGINTLSQDSSIKDKDNALPMTVNQSNIKIDQVSFLYNSKTPVFDNLNLTIKNGEKVGIVGRSGAGKSTLVNLLLRFYDIDSGKISIDGQDISAVQQESLRSHIAVVTQDTSLLHRSVRENILFGRPNASEKEMIDAAKKSHAHDFILSLSDHKGRTGYDAHVGERGVTLSGGQRQRIAIARVLLKDAPILVLDEATSALDSEVEESIQQNLNVLMQDKTVIAIAHRLSTIAAMDRLIVLDKGVIIEQGSHNELIRLNGIYTQLWNKQSGGFL